VSSHSPLMLMVCPRLRLGQGAMDPSNDFFWELMRAGCGKPVPRRGDFRAVSATWVSLAGYNVAVAFVIRDFKSEDFETLWRMDQECFPAGIAYSKQELKSYLRHKGSFTLVAASSDGKVAGFIVVHSGPTGHVITIDVISTARRSGVGSRLLQAAEDRLRAAGSSAVGLETAVDNLVALSFYKRHGYSVIRTWPRYYSNGVDALVMQKELGDKV
jgi:[ribosomal protein S18]-alanine N-acetyltransferase